MSRDGVSRKPSTRKDRNILCIGRAQELLSLRAMVLRGAGFSVMEERDVDRAVQLALENSIDLVLFCHTVNALDQSRIICALRATRPHLPVASVTTLDYHSSPPGSVAVPSDPQKLIDALRTIFQTLKDESQTAQCSSAWLATLWLRSMIVPPMRTLSGE